MLMFYVSFEKATEVATARHALPDAGELTNTEAIGRVLYTAYVYPFQIAGLILLVAMIGAIVLTLRSREGVKRQDIARQVARKRADSVAVVQVQPGRGI
jgi:NADH-quinone oxidoreductase subunit J